MSARNGLDKERYLIDMHLSNEQTKDKLFIQAERLANLARCYKDSGFIKDAICEIKRSLKIVPSTAYKTILREWKKTSRVGEDECPYGCKYNLFKSTLESCPGCNRFVCNCTTCGAPNRLFDHYCRKCGAEILNHHNTKEQTGNLVLDWHHTFICDNLSPQPVMVGDLAVMPLVSDCEFMALKVANGDIAWKLENMFDSNVRPGLTVAYPYLYVYSTKRISRIMPELIVLNPTTIYADPESLGSYSSFPSIDKDTHSSLFPVNKGILFHDVWRKKGELLQVDIKKNDALFPIIIGSAKFIFSRKGEIFKLYSNKNEACHYSSISKCEIVGPPVSPAGSNLVYFEGFSQGKRTINVWSPKTKKNLSISLPDAFCSVEDTHFNNPPLLYKDGILLTSCQQPKLYYVKAAEGEIALKEIAIDISTGVRRVLNIESFFSVVNGSYFISRVPDGFFYFNLDDKEDKGMEFFGSDMMSRPLVFNNRVIFLCKDGARCYVS